VRHGPFNADKETASGAKKWAQQPVDVMTLPILRTYFAGLGVVHLAWLYFFTTGHLLRRRGPDLPPSLGEMVITSAAGMAMAGFGLVFLGFTQFLNVFGIGFLLLLEGCLFWWLGRGNWLCWTFWQTMFQRMVSGWTPPAIVLYVLLLALAVPAVLPLTFADSVSYHLAYAVEWANAGRVHVDPFLRFPYYANNFLLLYSVLFILKLGDYCQFLTWLCGLLSCLGVLSFLTPDSPPEAASPFWKRFQPQQFLIPLCLGLSPIFIRYLDMGMIDVPIGLFVLVPILCAYRSSAIHGYERELVATGAFCAGMKLTLIGHLPLFLGSLLFAARRRLQRREIALLALALVALSLPWYLRNLIEAHDPFPPVLNSYFHRVDPIFDRVDAGVYTVNTLTPRDPLHLLSLPCRFFVDPASKSFREIGVSALIILLYGPILFLIGRPFLRQRGPAAVHFTYLSIAVLWLIFPWLFSSLGRYSLHWYPVFVAWAGIVITAGYLWLERNCQSRQARWAVWVGTAIISALLICPTPTPTCLSFYESYYSAAIAESQSPSKKAYLAQRVNGYLEGQAVIKTLTNNGQQRSRVLVFGRETPAFYFRRAGIESVGDWFGPARWDELVEEIKRGNCRPYLERLHISAIIVDPRWEPFSGWYPKFQRELELDGFVEYRYGDGVTPVFLKNDMEPAHGLIPVRHDTAPLPGPLVPSRFGLFTA
jgi:hypothetical protein